MSTSIPAPPGGEPQPGAVAPAVAAPIAPTINLYDEMVDLNQALTPEQREAYKKNQLTPGVSPTVFVILSILTIGIFPTIYHQLKQSKLPKVKPDDPGAGKAIGFMFIPLFNIYWYFVVWPRLVDRINFQFRLRGRPSPINRANSITAQVLTLAGWIVLGIVGLAGAIWLLVLGSALQTAANELAAENAAPAIGAPA